MPISDGSSDWCSSDLESEIAGDEPRALRHTDRRGIAGLPAHPVQGRDHVLPAVAEPRVEHRREAWEGGHHRQYPDLAARCQLVVHEVHGPDIVRPDGL